MDHLARPAWQPPETSRRELDLALGVLMGLRGCAEREAFEVIATAARETGFGLGSVARALLTAASRGAGGAAAPALLDYWASQISELPVRRTLSA